ncbi:hypothetical protein VSS74_17100 [Conexibacter stalactiti]|uniref:Uncharacterized protein n=1 Tax=Conexibacter stalactiti TaxID=1940611 RepID=A0ABU4HRW9_9ACTN|nr:hypothetical protein [Conexibacter stalactiti]MDW5596067.1 hypothetical protein [Conexibacter stalactiti]MEC5036709.1 hypothetical protein [Conexibacter stalactiti]
MTPVPAPPGGPHRDPVARMLSGGALLAALAALVFSMTGSSPAAPDQGRAGGPSAGASQTIGGDDGGSDRSTTRRTGGKGGRAKPRRGALPGASTRPQPLGILRLDRRRRFPASVIPKVAAARQADRLGDSREADLQLNCAAEAVDLGSWCLDSATYPIPPEQAGKNDFRFAAKTCVARGGWLPTAAQLIGAAERVKLSGSINDSELTASVDENPVDGLKDQREMSATLFTTTAGSSAAGSQGPSIGSKGNPQEGEPDPIPQPADPEPSTLQYVTVFDNRDQGGFAGGKPVGTPERFRCAFNKVQGPVEAER